MKDPTISKITLQQKVLEQKEFSARIQIFHFASMSTGDGVALHPLSFDSSVQIKNRTSNKNWKDIWMQEERKPCAHVNKKNVT